MDWNKVEEIICDSVPLCIKLFLNICGFNTFLSLRNITTNTIIEIEDHINKHHKMKIQDLTCCYSEFYQNQLDFKLLPGHRAFLLEISKCLSIKNDRETRNETATSSSSSFSMILRKLIETARKNGMVDKNHHTFDDIIRFFSTNIFLLCGRRCYEVLHRNLPFPSISTVCEYHSRLYSIIFHM